MNHQYIEVVGDSSNFNNLNGLNEDNKTPVLLPTSIINEFNFKLKLLQISYPILVKCSLPVFVVDESYG